MFKHLFRRKSVDQILAESERAREGPALRRTLRTIDLVALGIAADPKVTQAAAINLDRVYERAADTLILAGQIRL